MDLSSELLNLIIRFGFNLSIAFIIIKLIYKRNHSNNLDFVFTYFMFNSLIFFFAFLLSNITINMGFAFGLFAVFAILRYRTDPIPIKEMTYLFIVITIGVINALSGAEVSYAALLFTNIALVGLTYLLETYWQNNTLILRMVEYEIIENIKSIDEDMNLTLQTKQIKKRRELSEAAVKGVFTSPAKILIKFN